MLKLHREIMRDVRRTFPDAEFHVKAQRKHLVMSVSSAGRSTTVTCSVSPSDSDSCKRITCHQILRSLRAPVN